MLFMNSTRYSSDLHQNGFVYIPAGGISMSNATALAFEAFRHGCFDNLREDCPGRERGYIRAVLLPDDEVIDLRCGSPAVLDSSYFQSTHHNPEAGGLVREFASPDAWTRANPFLSELVMADWRVCAMNRVWPHARRSPIQVGVHLIRLSAMTDRPGIALPNRPHKDGEPFTFIHLINRQGVTGGETAVYANGTEGAPGALLHLAPLVAPLDTVAVYDCGVYHDVRPVRVERDHARGYRDVVLIDFSPLVPVTAKVDGSAQVNLPQMRWPFQQPAMSERAIPESPPLLLDSNSTSVPVCSS